MTVNEKKLAIVADALSTIADGIDRPSEAQRKREYIAVAMLLKLVIGGKITKDQVDKAMPW